MSPSDGDNAQLVTDRDSGERVSVAFDVAGCVTSLGADLATLTKSDRGQLMLVGVRIAPRKVISRRRRRLT